MLADIEADGIGEFDRPHRHAEGDGGLVELLLRRSGLEAFEGLEHVRRKHAVDEEARHALDHERKLRDRRHEGAALVDLGLVRGPAADHFHQRHLGDRIEEVDADQATRIIEAFGDLFDHDRGGIGRHHRTGLQLALEVLEDLALDVEPLHDRLDDDIGAKHVEAVGIGNQARLGRGAGGGRAELAFEELGLRLDALLDLLGREILQRGLHAGCDAPAGDVGAHHACPDDVDAQRRPLEPLRRQALHLLGEREHPAQVTRRVTHHEGGEGFRLGPLHPVEIAAMLLEEVDQAEGCRIVRLAHLLRGLGAHLLGDQTARRPLAHHAVGHRLRLRAALLEHGLARGPA